MLLVVIDTMDNYGPRAAGNNLRKHPYFRGLMGFITFRFPGKLGPETSHWSDRSYSSYNLPERGEPHESQPHINGLSSR